MKHRLAKYRLRITIVAAVTAIALISVACGGAEPSTTTEAPSTEAPTTEAPTPPTTQVVPAQPVVPPPASFSEVESAYVTANSTLLAQGAAVVEQFLSGDAKAMHARLDDGFAAELSVDEMAAIREEMNTQQPLGGLVADRAVQMSPTLRVYIAELEWGDGLIAMTASFNEAGEISGLFFAPRSQLPADPASDYKSAVEYRLPFDGLWLVGWGGDTEMDNYHVIAGDQRHAFDIMVWKDGGTHSGDGSVNEDYWAYGQPVLAPAAGTVVTAIDGLADQTPQVGSDPANPAGNHVVIEVAEGEYVLIAHMQSGSINVAVGDTVSPGDQIGLVGNSGNTSEPHIHIHVQDQPVFDPRATGLPLDFSNYIADGQAIDVGQPLGGEFIVSQ